MHKQAQQLPAHYKERKRRTVPATVIPNVNPFSNVKGLDYLRFGKNDDRNVIGQITKTVEVRNANREVIRMKEEHMFANGARHSQMRINNGHKSANYSRRRNNGSYY